MTPGGAGGGISADLCPLLARPLVCLRFRDCGVLVCVSSLSFAVALAPRPSFVFSVVRLYNFVFSSRGGLSDCLGVDGTTHARSKRALQFQAACEVCRLYLETYLLTVYLTTAQSTALVTKENNEQKQVRSIEGGLGRGGQETGGGGGAGLRDRHGMPARPTKISRGGRGPPHSRAATLTGAAAGSCLFQGGEQRLDLVRVRARVGV